MVEWLAMMHVTPVVLSLNPHVSEIAFPQPKVFQKKVIAQTTKCPSMTAITVLTQTNCELKIIRFEMFLQSVGNLHSEIPVGKTFTQ